MHPVFDSNFFCLLRVTMAQGMQPFSSYLGLLQAGRTHTGGGQSPSDLALVFLIHL